MGCHGRLRGSGRRSGKSRRPGPPERRPGRGPLVLSDPGEVEELLRQQDRRTEARSSIARRHTALETVSPQVGSLDEQAMAETLAGDLDEGISLLRDLARATDPALRARARQLAASLLIPATRTPGHSRPGGSAKIGTLRKDGVDLDIDATLEKLVGKAALSEEDLLWRGWVRPGRSVVVVVDASGSVNGRPLETAVVTAAALAGRLDSADELAVVAFWSKVLVLRHLSEASPPAQVIERLLALRSGDTTDLAGGITAGLAELATARTARKDVIVITDGMANEGGDPTQVAESARAWGARLHVLALPGDDESARACERLASSGGGLLAQLERPGQAAQAVAAVLGDGW